MSTQLSPKTKDCLQERRRIREKYGTSVDDECTRILHRERLAADRDKRKRFKWPNDYKRLYERQKGVCPRCNQPMVFIQGEIHIDHFDAGREDFNADTNLRVLHRTCNESKGANSIIDEAKRKGITVKELLEQQMKEAEV